MAYDRYAFTYVTGRQSNVVGLIWTHDRASLRTTGTTLTAIASVADSGFAAGRLAATEKLTSNGTGTGCYILDAFPALTPGFYVIDLYDVATPSNSSPSPITVRLSGDASGQIYWDGTDLVEGVSAVDIDPNAFEPGGDQVAITVIEDGSGDPIQGAQVWLTSDAGGNTVVAGTKPTDSNGLLNRLLTDGADYYIWIRKDGYESIQGQLFTADAGSGNEFELEPASAPVEDQYSVTYLTIRSEVGRYLGWKTNAGTWDAQQVADMQSIIDTGYRSVLYHTIPDPEPVPKDAKQAYTWSFLRPTATLSLVAGQRSYDLPADFAVLTKEGFTYANTTGKSRIGKTTEAAIRAHYAAADVAGDPKYCAVHPKTQVEGAAQGYQVSFYPVPADAATLTYRYSIAPAMLSEVNLYPVGGPLFGELVKQACIATAERRFLDTNGIQNLKFQEMLIQAVLFDMENKGA